jgi:hypothetical protein
VNPVYRPGDVLQDPALFGVWKDEPDGKERWTFRAGQGKAYNLEVITDNQPARFDAHLFKIGDELFLDLFPAKASLEARLENNPYSLALAPTHVFLWVRAIGPSLRMSCMNLEWLTQELKRDPKTLSHVVLPDERVLLTATTEAIQSFVKQHLKVSSAWTEMYGEGLAKEAGDTKNK